ncbi:MAG: hypothetical protein K5644_05995 [Lachnospiraceae bacterium]|nr:hypothetical protein [Lachnospiraceae bacterium]
MKVKMISKDELEELFDVSKLKDITSAFSDLSAIEALKNLKKEDFAIIEKPKKKKKSKFKIFLGILCALAAICGVVYLLLQYFKPEYEDEFMDDIDDEFYDDDDELFDDDEEA